MPDLNSQTDPKAVSSTQSPWRRRLRRKSTAIHWAHDLPFLAMALPGVLLLSVFSYLPLVGIIIAFKDYRPLEGIFDSAWVGFENFTFLFTSGTIWLITANTLLLNTAFIVTSTVVSLALALMINEVQKSNPWAAQLYQSVLFVPYFIAYTVVAYLVFTLLNAETGVANQFLKTLGLASVNWYSDPRPWPVILILVNLWKWAGFGTVLYLSGLLAVDSSYYEAASLDGASKWQQVRYISLPFLYPLITINILLQIGRIFFADFGLFFNVPRDSPLLYPATDVIDTFVFRSLRSLGDFGMAGAAALVQSVAGFALVLLSNYIVRRHDPDRALF
jgi:putative aldouronate transport system permease protein